MFIEILVSAGLLLGWYQYSRPKKELKQYPQIEYLRGRHGERVRVVRELDETVTVVYAWYDTANVKDLLQDNLRDTTELEFIVNAQFFKMPLDSDGSEFQALLHITKI